MTRSKTSPAEVTWRALLALAVVGCGGPKAGDGRAAVGTPGSGASVTDSGSAVAAGSGSAVVPGSGSGSAAASSVDAPLAPVPAAIAGKVGLAVVASKLKRPVLATALPGDPRGRVFVLEQHVGRIRVIEGGALQAAPLLDVGRQLSIGNEQGLLGLALHPAFATNGRAFINLTGTDDGTRIIELAYDAKAGVFDPTRQTLRWSIAQPYSNHNGGHLQFGPDGKLYVGMGDGGSAGDPLEAGQDPKNHLAKMLRFDVEAAPGADGAWTPEVVHLGVRNPWRFDFDPVGGALYIGDVGQNEWENIYVVAGDDARVHNFGWSITEGAHCYVKAGCDQAAFTAPAVDYPHAAGCSVTGGVVYRGKALPDLAGAYFYADYCTGMLRSFRWAPAPDGDLRTGGIVTDHWDWKAALDPDGAVGEVSSFGRDADGELLIVSLGGTIWRLTPKP